MFDWVENRLLAKGLKFWPSLQIKPKKYSARKYVWYRFWKCERSWWDSKQNECLCWRSHPKGFLKTDVITNFAEFTRKHLWRNLFFGVFLWILRNLKEHLFAEEHRTTASDYSSINSSEWSISKRNGKLWYKSTA